VEFDASILGGHTIPRFSKTLKGVVLDILAVDYAAPGKSPTVTFSIKDGSGKPIDIATMSRLNLVLAGPNTDYSYYVSEAALRASGPGDGRYYWTFAARLPENATGSYTVGIEGRRDAVLMPGTQQQQTIREVGKNKTFAFAVDGSAVKKRRTVVTLEKCNACHYSLSFHGDNRNTIEQCVLCHNPNTQAGGSTVDFRVMVHRIHTGEELSQPYKLGNTVLSEAAYPGDRRVCSACHVNGTENVPLADGLLAVKDAASPMNPIPPATAACTACHDARAVYAHAASNTNALGESCGTCHGVNGDHSVANSHAR
jgi:OmcA/MtrC family decaheme c-type cytochrome